MVSRFYARQNFSCGPAEGTFCTNKPRICYDLKENFRHEIESISAEMLQFLFSNLEHHVHLCVTAGRQRLSATYPAV